MKIIRFCLPLLLLCSLVTGIRAQTESATAEKIWKGLSRLPQNLRDDLKKNTWWKNADAMRTGIRLDSTVKYSSYNAGKAYPLNKSTFEYPNDGKIVQMDFVNYGKWVPVKRTTLTRDAQNRIVEVSMEDHDPATGTFQPSNNIHFYWRNSAGSACDSILSSLWDDQWQQWMPEFRLYSFFDAQNRETATETYRYAEGIQFAGIREEYRLDAAGDATETLQFVATSGKWKELGKVSSTFDKEHRETARQEDIAGEGVQYAPVRKLRRNFDAQGRLTLEERAKWNAPSREWSPLKSISMGYDAKKHQEWALTKSYKANSHFQNKMEVFRRPDDENPEREVISNLLPETNTWQILAETRYFYSK